MFWLTAIGQLNCRPPVPCALTFVSFEAVITCSKRSLWRSSQPYHLEQFAWKVIITWTSSDSNDIIVGEIFSVQAYHHLLTVMSSMITRKLNPKVYDCLLVLLDAVRLYRVYRR